MGLRMAEPCPIFANARPDCPLAGADASFRWFAIQTRSRHEKRVTADLVEKAVQAFLPLCNTERQWSDRRKVVDAPLFPGYVFVRLAPGPQARVPVLRTNGVISFLGVRGAAVPIPESEISAIRTVLRENAAVAPHPFLELGQRVRICKGSLDGVEGILTAMDGKKRLVVSIQLIQRAVAVRITGYAVAPV